MLISDKLPIILLGEAFHRILSFFSATQIVSNHFGVGEHLNIIKILEKVGLGERWRGAPAHLSSPSAKRPRAVIDRQSLNSETTRDIWWVQWLKWSTSIGQQMPHWQKLGYLGKKTDFGPFRAILGRHQFWSLSCSQHRRAKCRFLAILVNFFSSPSILAGTQEY